ncbi:hypothetical protein KY290_012267 [Solanum tuberosum]|uniref:Uncharacterized protein n=1 Tax=Solanum tuberosum TaxID=4113 RepID=A0ABQ7W3G5_SOLTU|nr:hypothetical protein KY290_012267 [Solanum tuberosum]
MSQSVALKKKGSNPNKAQSPLKNMNFDMQYRSRKSKLVEYKSVIQSSSREELGTSHIVVGKGQTKKILFQSGESIQEKGIKLPMHNFRFRTSSQKGVTASVHVTGETLGNAEEQHDIQDLLNFKQVKRKSVLPATSLDQFLEEQQLQKEHDINDLPNCKQPKKVRGKTTCKDIHAINLEERKEVTFDKGQAVGPTGKIVSELTNFIGTISRNPRFINLMYTSWHAVPKDTKKRMWEYINAMCEMNSQNRKKQKWRHRMGPINFARVRVALRATKENNEEPSKCEMFIATRTKTGKEIQADTQVAIAELQKHQNFGETADDAFTAVFGKEQPGRLRCYGRSVTTSF